MTLHHKAKRCQLPDLFDWVTEQDSRVAVKWWQALSILVHVAQQPLSKWVTGFCKGRDELESSHWCSSTLGLVQPDQHRLLYPIQCQLEWITFLD